MKSFMILMAFVSLLSVSAFAGETTTDCPMMREQNLRNNPKSNLDSLKTKTKTKSASGVAQ